MKMLMNKRIGNRRYIILWNKGIDFSRFGETIFEKHIHMIDENGENVNKIYEESIDEIDRFIDKIKKINK